MRIQDANKKLKAALQEQYDDREVQNIAKFFWEDLFGYRGGIDRHLHSREIQIFNESIEKLMKGEPIQYVTKICYFYNVKLKVNKHVLIPRPETEELVHHVLSDKIPSGARVLDVGTGSGCIPIVLKRKRPDLELSAIDISKEALSLAKANAEKNEVKIKFKRMDFLSELAWENFGLFEVIISNPPYIDHKEKKHMTASTKSFEPSIALYPDHEDVLIFYKKIADFSKEHLTEKGSIYLECNEFNAKEVKSIFKQKQYKSIELLKDMQGKDRFVVIKN